MVAAMNTSMSPKHAGIDWVFGYTGLPKSTIRRLAVNGAIPARRIAGRWRFETERVRNWFDGKLNTK